MASKNEFLINVEPGHVWSRSFMDSFIGALNKFESAQNEEALEKSFNDMKLEIIKAYREFEIKIRDLPLIMKCRIKCDRDSNFGGLQCYLFASKLEHSITKYLNDSGFNPEDIKEDSLAYVLKKIKDKAQKDKAYANDFERETKKRYLTYGIDNTLEIFKKGGYNIR